MKKLSTFFIILGILIISIPIAGHIYTSYKQDQLYQQYLTNLGETDLSYESPSVDMPDITATDEKASDEENKKAPAMPIEGVIGTLAISDIKCNQLLLEGSEAKQLKYGVGHITGTALPGGGGNFAVAGHRNHTFGTYFNRIDELENGNIIEVSYENATYHYEVFDSFVVEPTDISVLKDIGEPVITLITCHPKGSNAQRLIVRGKLL